MSLGVLRNVLYPLKRQSASVTVGSNSGLSSSTEQMFTESIVLPGTRCRYMQEPHTLRHKGTCEI